MTPALLKRLRGMDGEELKFRAKAALRSQVGRARVTLRSPAWHREELQLGGGVRLETARASLARQDWLGAHQALAGHFATRPACFPLDPRQLPSLAARVRGAFPNNNAAARAERILKGRYDLLGYREVATASPPDWHRDPVHDRAAPLAFWNAVPYLDPAHGDHKVTWELNRHQHFLALGRAFALTGDRRFYLEFVRQLNDWIAHNPPLLGTNWASMLELGFRTLSWTWALHFFARAASAEDDTPWTVDLLLALDRQLEHVEQNLSRYFSPNTHLTGEALALYVAGRVLPELPTSAQRARTGREILLDQVGKQVLADGGHAELSAHYHRYSTDFYLFALAVARSSSDRHAGAFRDPAHRQARYLRVLADDRGQLPLTGDDDGGQVFPLSGPAPSDCRATLATAAVLLDDPSLAVGPLPEEAYWICGTRDDLERFEPHPAPVASMALPATGYCVSRNRRGDHLLFDCGPHGFLNGGHAHADALSVVLTVAGRPLLVDPGTATYTMNSAARDRFRSTAMHNTVVLDGRSQSEPSGPFHWRTRADASRVTWESNPDRDVMAGRHEAYAPLIHVRQITAIHGEGWIVVDRILGDRTVAARAMWHVHPDWSLATIEETAVQLRHKDGTPAALLSSVPIQSVGNGLDEFAPEYGRIERALCLEATLTTPAPFVITTVIPADGSLATARRLASSVHSG